MSQSDFKKFMDIQRNEVSKHRWIESEKVGYDLGVKAELDWIKRFAEPFRKNYKS